MKAAAAIVLCGAESRNLQEIWKQAAEQVACCQSPLQQATAGELNSAVGTIEITASIVVFVDTTLPYGEASLDEVLARFERNSQFAALWITDESQPGESAILDDLPAWVSVSLPSPAVRLVALRRDSRESPSTVERFPDIADPLRAHVVNAAYSGRQIEWQTISRRAGHRTDGTMPPTLCPAHPARDFGWICDAVEQLDVTNLVPAVQSESDVAALKAGLLQVNDFLDASHEFSQSVQGGGVHSAGDYWHAIMHRREPDYSNAKYWFRRVGRHPIFPELAEYAETLFQSSPEIRSRWGDRLIGGGEYDPFAFVDLCQSAAGSNSDDLTTFARQLQWWEMLLLLRQTDRDVIGG